MKRIKMIITSVAVLAIVGSAFAFKETKKIGRWCVTDSWLGTPSFCYTVAFSKTTTGVGTFLRYYTFGAWDGTLSQCQAGGANSCTVQARFILD